MRTAARVGSLLLLLLLSGCQTPAAARPSTNPPPAAAPLDRPYLLMLGTAQDAGFPQIGARHARALQARREGRRRMAASVMVCDPRSGKRWLLDASPDLPLQIELAEGHPPTRAARLDASAGRPPLMEGVFLTHAHIGHYTGLMHLGREAYGAQRVPVHGTRSMTAFLRDNGPWSLLVDLEHIELHELEPGTAVRLGPDLEVTAFSVPHRAEFTDTVGFHIRGPHRSAIYIPDIDKWERWDTPVEQWIRRVDVALLDGTFFAEGEIPGRAMADIPHPFVRESIARFAALPASERHKVVFTHLNHTNPAVFEHTDAAAEIRNAGHRVARDGQVLPL